jgi:small subunit ribosomal protein S8e
MVITQSRPNKKQTGSRYKDYRKKKKHEMGRLAALTKLSERKLMIIRTLGGNKKMRLLRSQIANVLDKKTNNFTKAKITNILENPANRHFVRRNIITKGTIIQTDAGKAKVTSRPGQDGTVNAILIS